MLPEVEPWMRAVAAVATLALVASFVVRAIRKDRREFSRFRRYRSTARRQKMMRRWLIESALVFGGTSLLVLAAVWPVVTPLLEATQSIGWIAATRDVLAGGLGWGLAIGALLGLVILTIVGARSARKEGGVIVVGDIAALLPRNRPELGWGAALSINAGIAEELLFRLALPALLVIVTGEPLSAFGLAALIFGLLHAYQGPVGVIATTIVGLLFTALYVVSGSIVLVIVAHALFDLRTLVIIPMAVYGVHRVPGSIRFPKSLPLAPTESKKGTETTEEPAADEPTPQPQEPVEPADETAAST